MIGVFGDSNVLLETDLLVGNTVICMGFKKYGKYYIPNTALKEDVRKLIVNKNKIIAILKKDVKEINYSQCTYLNQNVDIKKLSQTIDKSNKNVVWY